WLLAGRLGKELVFFDMHGRAELAFYRERTSDLALAAHTHVLGQRDLRGHRYRKLHSVALGQSRFCVEESTSRAQGSRKSMSLAVTASHAYRNRKTTFKWLCRS